MPTMKIPIEVKKKLEQQEANINALVLQLGQIEMAKEGVKDQAKRAEHERAQFWAQVCSEYKIDPAANYIIGDDGEVRPAKTPAK